jgi:hypothetical protein
LEASKKSKNSVDDDAVQHYGGQQPTDADRTAQHISPASVLRLIFQSAIRMS